MDRTEAGDPGEVAAIGTVVRAYFAALRASDTGVMARVFHPEARIMGAPEGREHVTDRADFLSFVARTPPPAATDERDDMVYDILAVTGSTAAVRCRIFYLGIYVTDLLLLARHTGGWCVMAKVFHRETPQNGAG